MKRFIGFSLLLASITVFAQNAPEEYRIRDFRAGLNTKDVGVRIEEGGCSDCQNVVFDEEQYCISKRLGYETLATLPVSGKIYLINEFNKQDGHKWLMVHIATSVYATDDCSTWVKVKDGLKEIYPGDCATYGDEWWFTNGVDDVFSWSGTTTTSYGFIPQGRYMEEHNNQLFVACLPENYSTIFWCNNVNMAKDILGWDYYNSYILPSGDGSIITGIKSLASTLIIGTNNGLWRLEGNGLVYEMPVRFSDVYGCVSNNSINKYLGNPIMMSQRGICGFSESNASQIDRQVEDITTKVNLTAGSIVGKYWMQTSENDFNLGSSSNVICSNGVIRLMSSVTYDANNKLSSWVEEYYNNVPTDIVYRNINNFVVSENYLAAQGGIANTDYSVTDGFYNWITLPQNDYSTSWIVKNIAVNLKRPSNDIYKSSVTLTIYDISDTVQATQTKWIDDLANGDWYIFFDTYTITMPRTFKVKLERTESGNSDTGIGYMVYTEEGIPYDYAYEWSTEAGYSANVTAWNLKGWEVVKNPLININGTKMHNVLLRKGRLGTQYKKLAVNYQYYMSPSTWGYLTSSKYNAGTSINTWKQFITADTGDGITYHVKYATSSTALDDASWTSKSSGDLVGATTSQYWVQWKATLNNISQQVESVLLRWFEGSSSNYEDCASGFAENRYHVAFSTTGYTNHLMYVFDRNQRFTKFNISAEAMGMYDNNLCFGKSNVVYKMYSSRNDKTAAIDAYWESKDLDFGNPDIDKEIVKIGVTAKGSGTLVVGFKTNYDTSYTTFPITLSSTLKNEVVNIPQQSAAQYWNLKLQNAAASEYFTISEISVYYRRRNLIPR